MIFETLVFFVATGAIGWVIIGTFVAVPDHANYDQPQHALHRDKASVSAANEKVLRLVAAMQEQLRGVSKHKRLVLLRRLMDEGFTDSPSDAEHLGVDICPADAAGVAAEWTLAPGSSAGRRLLYLHGGAFMVGSRASHRMITAALSKACGVAVLAIDYRLMPENRRIRSIRDCQAAYRWMLENGPDGAGAAGAVFVAGDSAGGNLTLMLSAWVRDEGLRQMDCAIAFSPNTDVSLRNPLVRKNMASDPMLGPGMEPLVRLPDTVRLLSIAIAGLMSPRNPLMSPQFGDLGKLPPTLVQASDCEMLLGDAIRYVNKARSQDSPVTLQVWPGMVHVWQMFQHVLPEARLAIEEVAAFVQANSPAAKPDDAGSA